MSKTPKIVGIISSPRTNGHTASLVREALSAATEEGATTIEIFLPKQKIEFCMGCFRCQATGKCPIPDDHEALWKLLSEADGILVSSPTYAFAPNAMIKRFMERMGMYSIMTSPFGGKYIASMSAAGGKKDAKKVAKELAGLYSFGIFQRSYITGILGTGTKGTKAPSPESLGMARALGRRLARDISTGKTYPMQGIARRVVFALALRPIFARFIAKTKDSDNMAVYKNLVERGLLGKGAS